MLKNGYWDIFSDKPRFVGVRDLVMFHLDGVEHCPANLGAAACKTSSLRDDRVKVVYSETQVAFDSEGWCFFKSMSFPLPGKSSFFVQYDCVTNSIAVERLGKHEFSFVQVKH